MNARRWWLVVVSFFLMTRPMAAHAEKTFERFTHQPSTEHPVTAELIVEHASIQPGGSTRVGVRMEIENGWHIYADPSGDAGLPTEISWHKPSGAALGSLQWPSPESFLDPGELKTFGYTGTLVVQTMLEASPRAVIGSSIPLEAEVRWLACREICLPGSASVKASLPVTSTPPTSSAQAELFELTDQ